MGVFEGLYTALKAKRSQRQVEFERTQGMLKRVKQELALEKVFGKEWWGKDGLWTYPVDSTYGSHADGDTEITFRDVVDCHPLLREWTGIMERELMSAGISTGRFEGNEWEQGRLDD